MLLAFKGQNMRGGVLACYRSVVMCGGGLGCMCVWGGYILVMLTEFYKLWLTPLPTADWILNKHSQVDEFSGVSAQAGGGGGGLLHQCRASPMGPPHQPVLFLAAAEERGSLWGGREWGRTGCIWGCVLGGVTSRGGGGRMDRKVGRREEGKITPSSSRKLCVASSRTNFLCGFDESR